MLGHTLKKQFGKNINWWPNHGQDIYAGLHGDILEDVNNYINGIDKIPEWLTGAEPTKKRKRKIKPIENNDNTNSKNTNKKKEDSTSSSESVELLLNKQSNKKLSIELRKINELGTIVKYFYYVLSVLVYKNKLRKYFRWVYFQRMLVIGIDN